MLLAAIFAFIVVGARGDQIIAGTALTLGAVGLTGTIYRSAYGASGAGLGLPTLPAIPLPGLDRIPLLGPALFNQPAPTYIAVLALPVAWWVLFRTRLGLALRATGEAASLARAAGVRTRLIRAGATIVGGGFAGFAGATLVLAQVGTFAEKMTAGRGYVAIAIVVLGRWHPAGIGVAALLFGRRFGASIRLPGDGAVRALSALPHAAIRARVTGIGRRGRPRERAGGSGPSLVARGEAVAGGDDHLANSSP